MTIQVRQYGGLVRFVEAFLGSNGIAATIPSTADAAVGSVTVTPTGGQAIQAPVGSLVRVAPQVAQTNGVTFSGSLGASGALTITAQNKSGGAYNPGALTFNVVIEVLESF